ncbi:MAG: adenosylcobinamide-phosphate synthase CbiB [Haloarculaceae archaeon]
MTLAGPLAVVVAAGLEMLVSEPPVQLHPVAWFGRAVAPFDREWATPGPRTVGVAVALLFPLVAAAAVGGAVWLADIVHPLAAGALAGLALFAATSLRMLLGEARRVNGLVDADPDEARTALRSLAGRDATDLSAGEVRSAAVESAAENLADGLVAPLLAFAALAPVSLPLAAGAAAWVKAVNTLDSMLGYRSKPVGWASARLDDLAMWVPARLSAVLLAVVAGSVGALGRAREWASEPPSPNSGWPMATLAALLDVRLEKPGVYVLNPGGVLPTEEAVERGVALVRRAGLLAYVLAGAAAGAGASTGVLAWS